MITGDQQTYLETTARAATAALHLFPGMAAAEAALESGWGTSELAREDRNVFGMKQHEHPVYGTVSIPTREFLNAKWLTVDAEWVVYPTLADCFRDRMQTLRTLMGQYPHYCEALAATTAEDYVTAVSKSWSSDPDRAAKVIAIYHAHQPLIESALSNEAIP